LIFSTQGELTFAAHGGLDRYRLFSLGLRHVIRNADAVTACSSDALAHLRVFAAPKGRSLVIPNGVDPSEFEDAGKVEAGFEPYVLAVGRLVPEKGFDVLIDAFAGRALAELNLVVAGDGEAREELRRRAAAKGVANRVHLVGTVDRPRLSLLLRRAEAFASASRQEGFPLSVLEAMAAGTPVVATAVGGVTELARDGGNALVVPPDDPSALAGALARVIADGSLRSQLSRAGTRTAYELAWTQIVERYEVVYLQVLGSAALR
jgi:glycosyltransferase involved in cell wall biosynthesis